MSYLELQRLLQDIFGAINTTNMVPSSAEVWADHETQITALAATQELQDQFTRLRADIQMPKAVEAARMLRLLRQRMRADADGKTLVGRFRAEVLPRHRPTRDRARNALRGRTASIAQLAPPEFTHFSGFQVEGWKTVLNTIRDHGSLVVVAPTGSGKSEVFLMPIVEDIARSIAQPTASPTPRFVLLYPRVALLKDQLQRIFRYVYHAEQQHLATGSAFVGPNPVRNGVVIGFQFDGIKANAADTLGNREVFAADRTFLPVETCPICNAGVLRAAPRNQAGPAGARIPEGITILRCNDGNCNAEFRTSISKKDHGTVQPHILVTTAESLDRLYLQPTREFEAYLSSITGIVFDEVHLYYSLYGVHIYNLLRRLEEMPRPGGHPLTKIAASATIPSPERFVAKLFHGDENHQVTVHDATDYPQDPSGLEVIYFLQSPEEENRPGAAPTLIQGVMAMSHGILRDGDRMLVFVDSRDNAGRLELKIRDADNSRRLWQFRIDVPLIRFGNDTSPLTNPVDCVVYQQGECWRGLLGGERCHDPIVGLNDDILNITQVSSLRRATYTGADVVVTTPTLEVGVDDASIKSTVHYLPPRTVFSFIQRRGRAGRQAGEMAYTIMVLGNTPSDHFYFFRRNRLVAGRYELPLNPQNPVVRDMHDCLQEERNRLRELITRFNYEGGLWRWVREKLVGCGLLQNYYSEQLANLASMTLAQQKTFVEGWITGEKERLQNYLSLRHTLREIENESPGEVQTLAQNALEGVDAFLTDGSVPAEEVGNRLAALFTELNRIRFFETDPDIIAQLNATVQKVQQVWGALTLQHAWGMEPRTGERLYDFFRTLERLFEHPSTLRYAPNSIKIVLQAMFYLHVGLEDTEEPGNCTSRVDYFIPDAYFQVVRPVVVEVRYPNFNRPPDLRQEDVTTLSTLLIPYKPVYRYYGQDLSVLDTTHSLADVSPDGNTVRIHLLAEGVRRQGALEVQKIYVKPLRSDPQGQQILQMCPRCYAVYDVFRTRPCHEVNLQLVKFYAEPIVERTYRYQDPARHQISSTLYSLENVEGITTVRGSDVRVFQAIRAGGEYRLTQNIFRQFQALYADDTLPRYRLLTKGLSWDLSTVVESVLQDEHLPQEVAEVFRRTGKTLDVELVLHTAAHMLAKAVAAISGVNEQMLEYWYDVNRREVAVWERYEGGAGITDIFINALRANPFEVYRELLASVLCPVNLSEQANWTDIDELRHNLAQAWSVSPEDEFLSTLVRDAEGERQAERQHKGEEIRLTCERDDGCPACIHTTYCTDRNNQVASVSRLVGEALLRAFVSRLNRRELEQLVQAAINNETVPPLALYADPEQGIYDVLLL